MGKSPATVEPVEGGGDGGSENYGKPRAHDPDFKGPIQNRGCTDVLCLLLLVAFLVGWAAVGMAAFTWGDPSILFYPSDSRGDVCGKKNDHNDYTDRPNLLFFDITKCFSTTAITGCATPEVCVKACPKDNMKPSLMPTTSDEEKKELMKPYCNPASFDDSLSYSELARKQICPDWVVQSRPVFGRCVPSVTEATAPPFLDYGLLQKGVESLAKLLDLRGLSEKALSDLSESWWVVVLLLLAASLTAFFWIILMRYFAAVMVWTSVFAVVGLLAYGCVRSGMRYVALTGGITADPNFDDLAHIEFTKNTSSFTSVPAFWMVLLIVGSVVLLLLVLTLIFLRKRISIAIEIIEDASIAVAHMISVLFFPVVPFAFQIGVLAWTLLVGVYLASSQQQEFRLDFSECKEKSCSIDGKQMKYLKDVCDPNDNSTFVCDSSCVASCVFYKYGPTSTVLWFQAYNIFGSIWLMFFVSAMADMVLAGAFASWYWTLDKKNVPSLPILSSLKRTLFYHLGTLAFGSLLVAIVRVVRLAIEYVESKLKQYHQDNPLVKAVLTLCRCCFWCLEKFIKFLNRNAFIMTALYGKNFCWSAKEAFFLLMRNVARAFVLDKVTDFILLLGKLLVAGAYGLLTYYVVSGRLNVKNFEFPELNYHFVPVVIVVCGSYFIADVFFDVYEMGVDTLCLCFLEDLERNDGSHQKPYFMSKDLRKILDITNTKLELPPPPKEEDQEPKSPRKGR